MHFETFSLVPMWAQGAPHGRGGKLGKVLSCNFCETHTRLPL